VHALSVDPDHLLAGTADWLHQDQRRPAMPDSWTLMNHLRNLGHAAVISGAGPTVLVLGRPAELARLEVDPLGFRSVPLAVGGPATVTRTLG
jgi:homoserine kinase